MSVKSTYYIDRETALAVILSKVLSCSDEQLEEILEVMSSFRNYVVGSIEDRPEDSVIRSTGDWF